MMTYDQLLATEGGREFPKIDASQGTEVALKIAATGTSLKGAWQYFHHLMKAGRHTAAQAQAKVESKTNIDITAHPSVNRYVRLKGKGQFPKKGETMSAHDAYTTNDKEINELLKNTTLKQGGKSEARFGRGSNTMTLRHDQQGVRPDEVPVMPLQTIEQANQLKGKVGQQAGHEITHLIERAGAFPQTKGLVKGTQEYKDAYMRYYRDGGEMSARMQGLPPHILAKDRKEIIARDMKNVSQDLTPRPAPYLTLLSKARARVDAGRYEGVEVMYDQVETMFKKFVTSKAESLRQNFDAGKITAEQFALAIVKFRQKREEGLAAFASERKMIRRNP